MVENLEVVGNVDADPALCEQGFPTSDPDSADFWKYVPEERAAWELQDPAGNRWIIQFGAEGLTTDVLLSGDVVTFQFAPSYDATHAIPRGWVALERDEAPAVAIAVDVVPELVTIPDLAIEAAQATCPTQEDRRCGEPRAVRVNANGASEVVPMRESVEVGGVLVHNGYYSDNENCWMLEQRIPPRWSKEFQLAFRTPR